MHVVRSHNSVRHRTPGGADPTRRGGGCAPLFMSTYGGEPCGVAAFARDLADAFDATAGGPASAVLAVAKKPASYTRDDRVLLLVRKTEGEACRHAAELANQYPCTVVNVHHESGSQPGGWGEGLVEFARECDKPVVATLHMLAAQPGAAQKRAVSALAEACQRVVVTCATALDLLAEGYGIPPEKAVHIPRAIHQVICDDREWLRHRMCIPGGPLLLTVGPLCPQMGIEYMIDALPDVLVRCPNATYVVVGRTHRACKEKHGERYRGELRKRAAMRGVLDRLRFDDRPLSLQELMLYIKSADVFVSPSASADGVMGGPLAYAAAAGKPIVASPCLYAREMAAHAALVLAEFRDSASLAEGVLRVFCGPALRARLEEAARQFSGPLRWDSVVARYQNLFNGVAAGHCARREGA